MFNFHTIEGNGVGSWVRGGFRNCVFYFCFVHNQNDTYGSSLLVLDFSILIVVSYGVICASFTDLSEFANVKLVKRTDLWKHPSIL